MTLDKLLVERPELGSACMTCWWWKPLYVADRADALVGRCRTPLNGSFAYDLRELDDRCTSRRDLVEGDPTQLPLL